MKSIMYLELNGFQIIMSTVKFSLRIRSEKATRTDVFVKRIISIHDKWIHESENRRKKIT